MMQYKNCHLMYNPKVKSTKIIINMQFYLNMTFFFFLLKAEGITSHDIQILP